MGVKKCAVKDLKHDRGQQRTITNKRSVLTARAQFMNKLVRENSAS